MNIIYILVILILFYLNNYLYLSRSDLIYLVVLIIFGIIKKYLGKFNYIYKSSNL